MMADNGAAAVKDNYILNRDYLASARLRLQHFSLIQRQSWFVPPEAEAYMQSLPRPQVADLGTGNAIWATDFLDRYPHAQLTGLDVSDEQYPRAAALPENIRLGVHDMFAPVPEKYLAAFDRVHLRLAVGWIHGRDREALLRNILSMLKPGGYIQWEENVGPDAEHANDCMYVLKPDSPPACELPRWARVLGSPSLAAAHEWLQQLPEPFAANGLEAVQVHRPHPRKAVIPTQLELLRWFVIEANESLIRAGVADGRERLEEDVKNLQADLDRGYAFAYGWTIAIGKKPL